MSELAAQVMVATLATRLAYVDPDHGGRPWLAAVAIIWWLIAFMKGATLLFIYLGYLPG